MGESYKTCPAAQIGFWGDLFFLWIFGLFMFIPAIEGQMQQVVPVFYKRGGIARIRLCKLDPTILELFYVWVPSCSSTLGRLQGHHRICRNESFYKG